MVHQIVKNFQATIAIFKITRSTVEIKLVDRMTKIFWAMPKTFPVTNRIFFYDGEEKNSNAHYGN
jgi:hypothetical protein